MADRELTCCFSGHRNIPKEKIVEIRRSLNMEINWMLSHGIKNFITGGALGFDTLAALEILALRQNDNEIRLHLAIPCSEQSKYWKRNEIDIYNYILENANEKTVMCDHYHGGVMHMRNQFMVKNSRYLIYYYDEDVVKDGSKHGKGTLETVNYAKKDGLHLMNLCDVPPGDCQLEFDFSFDENDE